MEFGLIEMNAVWVAQIINTLLLLVLFIGVPVVVIRYLRRIDRRLKKIEELLRKHEVIR